MRFSLLFFPLLSLLAIPALGSHFRYATISWTQLFGTTIEVRIDQAWRRDFGYYFDAANCGASGCSVGSTTHTGTMQLTGASFETAEVYLRVTAVNTDQNYFVRDNQLPLYMYISTVELPRFLSLLSFFFFFKKKKVFFVNNSTFIICLFVYLFIL